MKAFVAMTETSLEYEGFANDAKVCAETEHISLQEAYKKIAAEVVAADANRPDGQKLWPKIEKGIAAANVLYARTQGVLEMDSQVNDLKLCLLDLKKAFLNGDPRGRIVRNDKGRNDRGRKKGKDVLKDIGTGLLHELTVDGEYWSVRGLPDLNDACKARVAECDAVYRQLMESDKCLNVIFEQRSRVDDLENYAR